MLRFEADHFDEEVLLGRTRRVSVCVPVLDEATTVATVLEPLVEARERGLVDEVVVADAGSTDGSPELAAAAGATVLDVSPPVGKGETVRRALASLTGDILVFVDGDLEGVDDSYVRALAGPLLTEPSVQLVKAAFQRPMRGERAIPYGGGRVTELTARPLLAAFYPELTALSQPLSGQIGVRREWIAGLPLWPGYGLEMGMLLATYKRAGLDAIAEADIGTLLNRHQDLQMLGRMAAEVLEVVVSELEAEGRYVAAAALAGAP